MRVLFYSGENHPQIVWYYGVNLSVMEEVGDGNISMTCRSAQNINPIRSSYPLDLWPSSSMVLEGINFLFFNPMVSNG